jgi:hypothetical protein
VDDFGKLRSVFTFLLHNGSPAFSVLRTLNVDLDSSAIAESDVVSTWRAMASDTIGYLADFNDIWDIVRSMSENLLQPRPISEMIEIILRMYSAECSLYENVNVFLRDIPVKIAAKFINEFRGILSYIYMLQASIDHFARHIPFEEEIVVYRIMKRLVLNSNLSISRLSVKVFFGAHSPAHLGLNKQQFGDCRNRLAESYSRFAFPQKPLLQTFVTVPSSKTSQKC